MGKPFDISIHSPHARGDIMTRWMQQKGKFQSTPLMRGETVDGFSDTISALFQSTPLMRGETRGTGKCLVTRRYFNPLPSCEGRHSVQLRHHSQHSDFNPLPSCEGRLCLVWWILDEMQRFQSTPLMRGETQTRIISPNLLDFNPLPSCEGRPSLVLVP